MSYMNQEIEQIHDALERNEVNSNSLFLEAIEKAKKYQETYRAFVTILETKEEQQGNTILQGIPYALKDNFSTKNILTTASSNILKDYVPVYDATVYQKLKKAGAVLMGKTVLDELAMGGTGTTGHTGIVKNPWDDTRIIGGSSAGSAAAVALGIVPFALGSDTGDSVRKPASFGGIVGFKPTYGRISRYGLFAFASSLDHVGIFARSVKDTAYVTNILKGLDPRDMTSLPDDGKDYVVTLTNSIKGKKLFYIKEICEVEEGTKETLDQFDKTIHYLEELGATVEAISFDKKLLNAIYPTYMTISCAEATSNYANLTGIPFGTRGEGSNIEQIIINARTNGFSELIKRRFILGSYVLQRENQEKLFKNAARIRHMIVDKINVLLQTYDAFILPSSGGIAPKIEESSDKLSDRYLRLESHLAIGNFGGYPSITLPMGFVEKMPVGVTITGRQFEDDIVLNLAYQLEQKMPYRNQIAKGEIDYV